MIFILTLNIFSNEFLTILSKNEKLNTKKKFEIPLNLKPSQKSTINSTHATQNKNLNEQN